MKCREYGATLVQIDTAQENNWILKNFPKGTVEKNTFFYFILNDQCIFFRMTKKKIFILFFKKMYEAVTNPIHVMKESNDYNSPFLARSY